MRGARPGAAACPTAARTETLLMFQQDYTDFELRRRPFLVGRRAVRQGLWPLSQTPNHPFDFRKTIEPVSPSPAYPRPLVLPWRPYVFTRPYPTATDKRHKIRAVDSSRDKEWSVLGTLPMGRTTRGGFCRAIHG